ncbi:hypothetical protein BASA81_008271 [Batrachochytrium salamandrivorans]|nr:hypothetical protein BASA81_008271 [Batrachochytrium salamandrivorans]
MQVGFDNAQLYSKLFSRNNKRQAHKNIRCFPFCSDRGHVNQGFCGQPIVFRVSRPYNNTGLEEIYAWGELKRADLGSSQIQDDHEPEPTIRIELGTRITLAELARHTKDPKSAKTDTLDKPLFEGFLESSVRRSGELKFSFNEQKKGWSYNWQASKHTAKARHAFFVYLFMKSPLDEFTCVGVHMSPSFILYCRKKKTVAEKRAEAAAAAAAATTTGDGKEPPPSKRPRGKRKPKPKEEDGESEEEEEDDDDGKRLKVEDLTMEYPSTPMYQFTQEDDEIAPQWFDLPPPPPPFDAAFPQDFDLVAAACGGEGRDGVLNEEEDEDFGLLDWEGATSVDPASVARLELVLQVVYNQLTREGTADDLNLNQFSLDWFVRDLDTVKEEISGGGDHTLLPMMDFASSSLVVQLVNYLLEESTLTATVRQIVENTLLDRAARRQALINMFDNELSTFLLTFGYSGRDLDDALSMRSTDTIAVVDVASPKSQHFAALEKQVSAQVHKIRGEGNGGGGAGMVVTTVPSEVDISGHWRLDDSVLSALDECRSRRGVPYMIRKMIAYTEAKLIISHTLQCVTVKHKSKLFSSGEEVWTMDRLERAADRAMPLPWSDTALQGETCLAWLDQGVVHLVLTHGGVVRTSMTIQRDESNRLVFDVEYLELDRGVGIWKCVFAKRGYAVRIASL